MSDPTDSTRIISLRSDRSLSAVSNSLISRGLEDLAHLTPPPPSMLSVPIADIHAAADVMVQGIRVKGWSFAEIVTDLADTFGRENIPAMREYLERGWDAAVKIEGVKPANYDKVFKDIAEAKRLGYTGIEGGTSIAKLQEPQLRGSQDITQLGNRARAKELVELGNACNEKYEYDEAITYFNNAIRLEPGCAEAYCARGLARCTKDNFKRVIDEVFEGKFDEVDEGELDKGIADYTEAIRIQPDNADFYRHRGSAYSMKGDYEQAVADYTEVIRLDKSSVDAYVCRARAHHDKSDYRQAIFDYTEAIRLDPKFAAAYNSRAWLLATCPDSRYRDGKRAVESALRACELADWANPDGIDTLAAAYAESGDYVNAVRWQEKAIDMAPDYEKADYRSRLTLYQGRKPYRVTGPSP